MTRVDSDSKKNKVGLGWQKRGQAGLIEVEHYVIRRKSGCLTTLMLNNWGYCTCLISLLKNSMVHVETGEMFLTCSCFHAYIYIIPLSSYNWIGEVSFEVPDKKTGQLCSRSTERTRTVQEVIAAQLAII